MTKNYITSLACVVLATSVVQAQTVSVTTTTATKKVVTVVNTTTAQAETTTVLTKSGTLWVQDTLATEVARDVLATTQTPQAIVIIDCNNNGVADSVDITNGVADTDSDGKLDLCETAYGDFNLNGVIDQQDVSILVGWWGIPNPLAGDLNSDGSVDAIDLGVLLARWGTVP